MRRSARPRRDATPRQAAAPAAAAAGGAGPAQPGLRAGARSAAAAGAGPPCRGAPPGGLHVLELHHQRHVVRGPLVIGEPCVEVAHGWVGMWVLVCGSGDGARLHACACAVLGWWACEVVCVCVCECEAGVGGV